MRKFPEDKIELARTCWPKEYVAKVDWFGFVLFDDFLEEYVQGVYDSAEEYIRYQNEEYIEDEVLSQLPGTLSYYISIDWAAWAGDAEMNGEFASWELDGVPGVLIISPA